MGGLTLRDGLELLFVVAVGGMVWSAVRRLRAGHIAVPLCPGCGRPASRAYPLCKHCGCELDTTHS
ncbi:MAG TPA: hypothetical protein VFJ85_14825 [Acidimicrobiales bacterium]|nr:hypothetical protein [Acidimicrobiales bacterium]